MPIFTPPSPALQKAWWKETIVYQIYPRSFKDSNDDGIGDLNGITEKLDYLHGLGIETLWLNPIFASPNADNGYDISDYRQIMPDFGTMEDFDAFVAEAHRLGMKVLLDWIANHTARDARWVTEKPASWYERDASGAPAVPWDWTDTAKLNYAEREVWRAQGDAMEFWVREHGVDGFRCDVASFVPLEFWLEARAAVEKVNPDCIWLAETVHLSYGCLARRQGIYSALDYDAYSAFDMEYEYDVREVFDKYLRGEAALSHYTDMLNFQEGCYPANYNKLRFLENHDQPRICSFVRDERALINYTAMLYFIKGTTLIYAGQEFENDHLPSLFDLDPIDRRTGRDLSGLLRRLYAVKQQLGSADWFFADADDANDLALLQRGSAGKRFVGVFSLKAKAADVRVDAADGVYVLPVNVAL